MITGLDIKNASIGSNLTVQLASVLNEPSHKGNSSDPITIGMDTCTVSKYTTQLAATIKI